MTPLRSLANAGPGLAGPCGPSGFCTEGFYHLHVELLAHFGDSRWGGDGASVSSHIPDPQ